MRVGVSESGCLLWCPSLCLSECLVPTELIGLNNNSNQNSSHCCVTHCVKDFRDIKLGVCLQMKKGEVTYPKTHSL